MRDEKTSSNAGKGEWAKRRRPRLGPRFSQTYHFHLRTPWAKPPLRHGSNPARKDQATKPTLGAPRSSPHRGQGCIRAVSPIRNVAHSRAEVLMIRAGNGLYRVRRLRVAALSPQGLQRAMKTKKVPRERNPFLLSGKRRWRLFDWIRGRTRREETTNNLLSQCPRPA